MRQIEVVGGHGGVRDEFHPCVKRIDGWVIPDGLVVATHGAFLNIATVCIAVRPTL